MHEGLTEDVASIRNLRVVTYVMEGAGVASLGCWVWWGGWCCSLHHAAPTVKPPRTTSCLY